MRSNQSDETHRSCGDGQDKSISGSFDNTTFTSAASSAHRAHAHSRGQDIARARPADHPVEQSTKFDPVINMKTAS
jgi:hypothetical protein